MTRVTPIEDARREIDAARKNRDAIVGVFVFEQTRAPHGLGPFTRVDKDIFVIWNPCDPYTDVYLSAAISVAKALVFHEKLQEKNSDGDLAGIESSVNAIEKHLEMLDQMETWTTTIQTNSGRILKDIAKLRDATNDHIEALRTCLEALKSA